MNNEVQVVPAIYHKLNELPDGLHRVYTKFLFLKITRGYVGVDRSGEYINFLTTSHIDHHYKISDFGCFSVFLYKDSLKEFVFGRSYATSKFYNLQGDSYKKEFAVFNGMFDGALFERAN